MKVEEIKEALYESYSKDLCYYKVQDEWNENNKCFGMCAITALIINDYFGGEICKIHVDEISHYFNVIDNNVVDLTGSQFGKEVDYSNYTVMDREIILTEDTKKRYITLKNRVIVKLLENVNKKIHSCKLCGDLVEKFPNSDTVYLGTDNDIVLIGEAPANNGWRKSGKLWKDINDKILPSGVVLQKLFDIINRNIFETTFIESVKCYPVKRNNLKICSKNCNKFVMSQLNILAPKLVITLGEYATRNVLNFKFDKFSSVVGNVYEVNDYKVLPIYHPSPISPKSYNGNVEIFKKIETFL